MRSTRRLTSWTLAASLVLGTAGGTRTASATPATAETVAPPEISAFATATLTLAEIDPGLIAVRGMGPSPVRRRKAKVAVADSNALAAESTSTARERTTRVHRIRAIALSPERARLMLQSLTVPGWGQATLGQRRAAGVFALLEAGVWGSFTAFRIQERMRRDTYERTAHIFGGVDLRGRDEEFRRIVGFYLSSDEYNRLVVRRDAANLYYGDPAAYDAYIAAHELHGADAWSWDSEASLERYRLERQRTQRATQRAHTAIAAAIINRLLSMVHVSRVAGLGSAPRTSWNLECVPVGDDPTAYRLGVRADF